MTLLKVLFILFGLIILAESSQGTEQNSLSLSQWEENFKNQINQGKIDITQNFKISDFEKKYLTRKNSSERQHLFKAREYFQKGNFQKALIEYNFIEKGSDNWLEAVEEKAWAYHRLKDFEKSLAQTKTLLAEPLIQIVGSEAFFLQSLSQLLICDYSGIFATQQLFKESQRRRILAIEELASSGTSTSFQKILSQVKSFPLTFDQVGSEAKNLPHLFYKDIKLQKYMLGQILTARAISIINEANRTDLRKSSSILKFAHIKFEQNVKNRLKQLARIEDKNNQLMLQKIGLIEVETIQRMHADKELDKKLYKRGQFAKVSKDDLIFPDDGKPWLDELDKYQVQANECPQDVRRKM